MANRLITEARSSNASNGEAPFRPRISRPDSASTENGRMPTRTAIIRAAVRNCSHWYQADVGRNSEQRSRPIGVPGRRRSRCDTPREGSSVWGY